MSNESENENENENKRIDIKLMESIIRLWRAGDISDEDLALEMDYMVPELKRCYEKIDGLLETIGSWGYVMCPRSTEWFEWDYGCQSEKCASFDDDCRELVEAS